MRKEEDIFVKSYAELTEKERVEHLDLFQDETEFEQQKQFIMKMKQIKEKEIIALNPKTKEALMSQFNNQWQKEKSTWYEKIAVFFFAPGKQLIFKPAFQMSLVLGLVFLLVQVMPVFQEKNNLASNEKATKQTEVQNIENFKELKKEATVPQEEVIQKTNTIINKQAKNSEPTLSVQVPAKMNFKAKQEAAPVISLRDGESNQMSEAAVSSGFVHSDWIMGDKKEADSPSKVVITPKQDQLLDLLDPAF